MTQDGAKDATQEQFLAPQTPREAIWLFESVYLEV